MEKLILGLAFAVAALGQGGNYRLTDGHEVVSECYDYSFHLPSNWYTSASNPVPFIFNFSPEMLASAGVGIPTGGATITVVPDAESHQIGSVARWMELDRAARGFSSVRTVNLQRSAEIERATEAVSVEKTADDSQIQTTAIYFEFEKQPFAAYLRYNVNDRNAKVFESALVNLVRSFRRLYGPHGTNCCCKR